MANAIQRLRYFDGEFLRSGDLTDEQNYHVSMRRRLTVGLHSAGIVNGLILEQDADSVPPSLLFFSVSAGLAIDQDGREIVIGAPYLLSSDNVLNRAGLQVGDSEIWIVYSEAATGLPSAGYARCDDPDELTRVAESFQLMLKPKGSTPNRGKDPDADLRGVRLGTITLKNDPVNGWTITAADAVGRTYVGVCAQSITSPDQADTDTFSTAAQNVTPPTGTAKALAPPGYIDVNPGVFARGNAFIQHNLVVGDDFKLDPSVGAPPDTGNLKLDGDLYLNGKFYGVLSNKWFALSDYIAALMPDIQMGFRDFDLTSPGGATSGSNTVTLTTKLATYKNPPQLNASIAAFQLLKNSDFTGMQSANGGQSVQVEATVVGVPNADPQKLDLQVGWVVSPSFNNGGSQALPLTSIRVAWMVVFTPGP